VNTCSHIHCCSSHFIYEHWSTGCLLLDFFLCLFLEQVTQVDCSKYDTCQGTINNFKGLGLVAAVAFLDCLRGTVVERRPGTGEVSVSHSQPAADRWVNRLLQVSQLGQLTLLSFQD